MLNSTGSLELGLLVSGACILSTLQGLGIHLRLTISSITDSSQAMQKT